MEKEIWLPVTGFEDRYFVSNLGRIRSNTIRSVIRKPHITPNGYTSYRLIRKDYSYKIFSGHRLVAIHFIPNPENKPEVNHIDGNKLNNNIENLEWCTSSENQRHAFDNGLQSKGIGYDNPLSKPIISIFNGVKENIGSITQASIKIGISRSCIKRSIDGNREIRYGNFKGYQFVFEK